MSIEVMSHVTQRYPGGGGELLVALALADNAAPDGQRIYPSIDDLAKRARLDRRTVQRHIRKMVTSGWLILVSANSGRRGDTNRYRISPEWLAGGECVPPAAVVRREPERKPKALTGDILSPVKSVDNSPPEHGGRVTLECLTGDTHATQTTMNHQNTLPPTPKAVSVDKLVQQPKQQNTRTSGLAEKAGGKPLPSWAVSGKRWQKSRTRVEDVGALLGIGRWNRKAYDEALVAAEPGRAQELSYSAYQGKVLQMLALAKGAGGG